MDEKISTLTPVSPAKSALPYGVIFGAIMVLEFVIMQALKPDPKEFGWIGIVTNLLNFIVLPTLFIALACVNFKNKLNGGYITLSQSLKIGVTASAIAGLVYAIFYFIYYLMFPEFIAETIEQMKIITIQQNPTMPAEQLEMTLMFMEKTMMPYYAGPISILMYTFIGLIISLIVGAIVKKENPGAF